MVEKQICYINIWIYSPATPVTVPKMLDDTDTDTFPVPNMFDTDTGTFFGTNFFRYRFQYHQKNEKFSVPVRHNLIAYRLGE